MNVWVLWWKYSDWSSMGIERVYVTKERPKLDLKLLEEAHTSKSYELKEIEVTT